MSDSRSDNDRTMKSDLRNGEMSDLQKRGRNEGKTDSQCVGPISDRTWRISKKIQKWERDSSDPGARGIQLPRAEWRGRLRAKALSCRAPWRACRAPRLPMGVPMRLRHPVPTRAACVCAYQQEPQYCGMCWLRDVVSELTPETLPHQKEAGSVDVSICAR